MTKFTSSRRKTARRFIRESTDRYQASSTYGRLLDINEQQDGTCLKKRKYYRNYIHYML